MRRQAIYMRKEFRVVTVRMIRELGRRVHAQSKELEHVKNTQTELKNTVAEVNNTQEGTKNRPNEAELS